MNPQPPATHDAARKKPRTAVSIALIVAVISFAVVSALFVAYRVALEQLRARVTAALGPESRVEEIRLSLRAIEITKLHIKAPPGWPAPETLTAERVVIVPDLGSLFSGTVHIDSIAIEGAHLSLLRTAGGKLRVLPSLFERKHSPGKPASGAAPTTAVAIDRIALTKSSLSFFDAAVANPALEVRLEDVTARISQLRTPALSGKSDIELDARVRGRSHQGSLAVRGWMEFASRDSDLRITARGVDIVALEPYLIKAAETGVRRGTLDLDLTARIASRRLSAPGKLTLNELELKPASGSFMGMPRDAVISMIRDRNGRIEVPFKLEGDMNDPNFSLDAAFKARVGIATAAALGVSIKGLIGELGGMREKSGVEKVDAVIESMKQIFRK